METMHNGVITEVGQFLNSYKVAPHSGENDFSVSASDNFVL